MFREITKKGTNGLGVLTVALVVLAVGVQRVIAGAQGESPLNAIVGVFIILASILALVGLFTVQPNDGKVLTLFGEYVGTVRGAGLFWANPFYTKKRISLRVRNFETAKLKVNDNHSNPIEIGAIDRKSVV